MARFEAEIRENRGVLHPGLGRPGRRGVFPATVNPLPQNQKLSGVGENQKLAVDPSTLTAQGKLDLAIRQAAGSMIPGLTRRTVVYVTGGTVPGKAFSGTIWRKPPRT